MLHVVNFGKCNLTIGRAEMKIENEFTEELAELIVSASTESQVI
jgi:hypothetical protein